MLLMPVKRMYWRAHEERVKREYEERLAQLRERFAAFTMLGRTRYIDNLRLVDSFRDIPGSIVECGTWKGGMIAGIAALLGDSRRYFLFDSYEGLPPPTPMDGDEALAWSKDTASPTYFDNCTARREDAEAAMRLSGVSDYTITKGWFKDTVGTYSGGDIAILRVDGDWYDSTTECLAAMTPYVAKGGVVIIDDYYDWDGCARAVHDFLARCDPPPRLRQFRDHISYIVM